MELDFSPTDWLLLTEQTMMVTIILSRWLLPKGEMTHRGLLSLLLLYLGLSADILDFSTIFKYDFFSPLEIVLNFLFNFKVSIGLDRFCFSLFLNILTCCRLLLASYSSRNIYIYSLYPQTSLPTSFFKFSSFFKI